VPGHFKGTEKNLKSAVFPIIKIRNFYTLHAIVEGCLYPMHKKWNTYMDFEPDTTIGKFEAGIMKFIVTTHPLQFTHCTEIRVLRHCL
jgi:hypothetical protein